MKLLFFLIHVVYMISVSEGICTNSSGAIYDCTLVDDLTTYSNFQTNSRVFIESKRGTKNELKHFGPIESENINNIAELFIKKSINGITPGAFSNFINLKKLSVVGNQLITIKSETFNDLPFTTLNLIDDEISEIEPGSFTNLPHLNALLLTGNKITKIKKGIFNNLEISFLSLSQNHISQIETRALSNLTKLSYLSLTENDLEKFKAEEILEIPETLESLLLEKNKFTKVSGEMLQGLINLKSLFLNNNFLSNIETDTFLATPQLQVLSLARNQLTALNGDILPEMGLRQLTVLELNHNKLQFLPGQVISRLPTLRTISIGGNPWQCACLNLVFQWLDSYLPGPCDIGFFQGNRPICVVPNVDGKKCSYSYDNESVIKYDVYNRELPQYSSC